MPSSVSSVRKGKGWLVLAAAAFIGAASYTAGWFYASGKLEERATADLAGLAAKGISANCENLHISGYPFRLDVTCDSISWQRPNAGISFQAGRIRSGSPIYAPRSLTSEITGPAFVGLPGIKPLELRWDRLISSAELIRTLPSRITTDAKGLSIGVRGEATSAMPLAQIADLHLEASGSEGPLEAKATFAGLSLSDAAIGKIAVPPLSGTADVQFSDAASLLRPQPGPVEERLRGQSGAIKKAVLSLPSGGSLTISGPFSIDDQGLIDGKFRLSLINPPALAETAQTLFPEQRRNISTLLFALSAMPKDENGAPTITVNVSQGKATAGFIPLGTLPAL
ncbi:DUF2125 domain-containing protein [Phyllobacterium leguminum]|uniref:DUF2125 domain-containing protein n=1 Tax=Phyllobacterium leguminum TaxID=314237 RepID=A0A318T8J6_9HYPH|nr:DUF2125 domain-containing protein [Phyllobacterium leguminum]PYE89023.1 hypothetical protein C7477_105124 [Phyllobacterium leguminum]